MEPMTTDIAVLERALVIMAACLVVQTLLLTGAAVGAVMAWRRATEALAEARLHLVRISGHVDDTAQALRRSTATAEDVMTEVRDAMGTVRNSVGAVTSMVTAPRTALALGLWRGVQMWRKAKGER
jgi:hypothetical protein